MEHPGPAIAEARARAGISQRELARRAGISPTTLRQLEAQEINSQKHTIGKIWRALEQADRHPSDSTVEFRSGTGSDELRSALMNDASARLEAAQASTEGALFRMALQQLQRRGLIAVAPDNPHTTFDLVVFERYPTIDDEGHGNQLLGVVDCRAVGTSTDEVFAGVRRLKAHVRELADDSFNIDDKLVQILVIEREPTEEEIAAYDATGVRIGHPGDWGAFDLMKDTSTPVEDG